MTDLAVERTEVRSEVETAVDEQLLFEALADPKCRSLVAAADRPATAAELGERCALPTSTLYRKLDTLERAGLLGVTARKRTGGNHAQAYERRVATVEVALGDDEGGDVVCVSLE
jgi:predicted transcriptional regulator